MEGLEALATERCTKLSTELYHMSDLFENALTSNRCGLAALTLIVCEYFVLLPREVDLFWKRRATGASVLFLSNRYSSLLSEVIQNAAIASMSDQRCVILPTLMRCVVTEISSQFSCANLNNATITIALLQYFPWAAFSALRTYALCRHGVGLLLGIFVFLLSSVPIAINFARYRWLSSATIPMSGCFAQINVSVQLYKERSYPADLSDSLVAATDLLPVTIISRVCFIAADLIVLGVTLRATYRTTRMARVIGKQGKHTFSGTLLLDGAMYFAILVTLNILHLLFTMLSISFNSLTSISYVTIFTEPITAVLISRFILDLQEVESHRTDPQLSTIKFTKVLGSLSAPLPRPGDTSYQDDWDSLACDDYTVSEADKEMHVLAVVARGAA
ncbi:hypothetical protein L226DRAFT_615200 [Lentinus tigrinus ALCF2SS1-7]|uniref:uncharacterized protein n=1 Tax=Lentinus tigrinus ALCF2SS1-7 TaxID=1328758 RepID=UPI001165FC20|nr:hypothetical protein L226DRAFT_615200 [Lentinus tigrinus ALCF2SS1-7]